MTVENPDPIKLEGSQYITNIQMPDASNQIMYYPSKPTPEFERKILRDKYIGTVVVVIGFFMVILGFLLLTSEISVYYSIAILLLSIFSFVFTIIFLVQENLPLLKTAAALPVIGYIIIVVVTIYHIAKLPFIISLDWETVFQAMPQLGDFIMLIGLFILRGTAILLMDVHKRSTDFSPSVIIIGPSAMGSMQPNNAPTPVSQVPISQSTTSPKASTQQSSASRPTGEDMSKPVPHSSQPQSTKPKSVTNLCSKCGKILEPDYSICPYCGARR